ncbi:hypothetical protein DOY81_002315, partial [Sarcophaga bullata]
QLTCKKNSLTSSISPKYKFLSLEPDTIKGSLPLKSTSFTLPLWPGNLYKILRLVVSHM